MKVESFIKILNADFFTGVPDSLLKPLCNYLMHTYGIDPQHHVVAANEGNCTALAAGYHLATGRVPVVYMQNSGEGNMINPAASLLNEKVYAIPMIFVIGWRGEPGVHDEPQHIFQGEITLKLLQDMGIEYFVIDKETPEDEASAAMDRFSSALGQGRQVAFVMKKGALSYDEKVVYSNGEKLVREEIIRRIAKAAEGDVIISTTGKVSRELFEIREAAGEGHGSDFLTVGSMGHCSSIALGVASFSPGRRVWCIDGDGSALMHMGAMALIGSQKPANLIHIILNNYAHETVGGVPTVGQDVSFSEVAKACGYRNAITVGDSYEEVERALSNAKASVLPVLIEIKCTLGAREDLGRPTTTAIENKTAFMEALKR